MHPQPSTQQVHEEAQKREKARREEQEREQLEARLRDFDAYSFYDAIESWAARPIPAPIPQIIQLTPSRRKVIMHQPLPLTRSELREMRKMSDECVRLLTLLRATSQRGVECPYIHRLHRLGLEKAISRCVRLKVAKNGYVRDRGFFAWCLHLLNALHLSAMGREVDLLQRRLEAVLVMCRHEEFASDLITLRREVSRRAVSR